jgi:hypothetical protein
MEPTVRNASRSSLGRAQAAEDFSSSALISGQMESDGARKGDIRSLRVEREHRVIAAQQQRGIQAGFPGLRRFKIFPGDLTIRARSVQV